MDIIYNFYKKDFETEKEEISEKTIEKIITITDGQLILCRVCQNIITTHRDRISINGNNVHYFINPTGNEFKIGCFKNAIGCIEVTKPVYDFTWFEGYAWSISVCNVCASHIGWLYISDNDSFYGLILDQLIIF